MPTPSFSNMARLMKTLFFGFQPNYIPAVAVVSVVLLAARRASIQ